MENTQIIDKRVQDYLKTGLITVEIEIPMNSDPIKYEIDKNTNKLTVDRILSTPMRYPVNYGYVPDTLSGDGDPVDVLLIMPYPLYPGVVIKCRPIGVLITEDESGLDHKILTVPCNKITTQYSKITKLDDFPAETLNRIKHFFEHYKDLEPKKWVKVHGWCELETTNKIIIDAIKKYYEPMNSKL